MKTPEEIRKALECCVYHGSCKTCAYFGRDGKCICRLERDALSYIRQLENHVVDLGKKVPKWISVKEQPPKDGQNRKKSDPIIRRTDDLGRVAIPKEYRERLGIQDGDALEIEVDRPSGAIIMRKKVDNEETDNG